MGFSLLAAVRAGLPKDHCSFAPPKVWEGIFFWVGFGMGQEASGCTSGIRLDSSVG